MRTFKNPLPPADRRAGVALIITIGLLSLLLLLAFTFAVSMQTERSAAQAATDGMQARQAVMSCLARAATDVNARIAGHVTVDYNSNPHQVFVPYPKRLIGNRYVRRETRGRPQTSNAWLPFGVYGRNDRDSGRVVGLFESAEHYIPGPARADAWRLSGWEDEYRDSITGEIYSQPAENRVQGGGHAWWSSTFRIGASVSAYSDYACTHPQSLRGMQTEPIVFSIINVNCSGYLDPIALTSPANAATRRYGTNVLEINTSELPGADRLHRSGLNPGDRPQAETWEDMIRILDLPYNNHVNTFFFPFSHFPVGEYLRRTRGDDEPLARSRNPSRDVRDMIAPAAYIAGDDPLNWSDEDRLRDAFRDAFPFDANPGETVLDWLIAGLKDYVDEDYEPRGLPQGYPNQEPAGKFNELIVEAVFTITTDANTNYTLTVECTGFIEIWNPYIWDPRSNSHDGTMPYQLGRRNNRWRITVENPSAAVSLTQIMDFNHIFDMGPRDFEVITSRNAPNLFDAIISDHNNFDTLRDQTVVKVNINRAALEANWGPGMNLVDMLRQQPVDSFFEITIPDNVLAPDPGESTSVTNILSIEALDPRFNYDLDDENYWRTQLFTDMRYVTISNYNHWTTNYLSQATNLTDGAWDETDDTFHEHYTYMYTANKPLRTVGELAYLAYAPWKTLRLFRHPYADQTETGTVGALHRVVDTFTLINTNEVRALKGMINPNTEHVEVLRAAFKMMPLDLHPDQDLSDIDLILGDDNNYDRNVAEAILAHTSSNVTYEVGRVTGDSLPNNFFYEVSDMGRVRALFTEAVPGLEDLSNFEKEAIIRNSCGFFNTRQNMFMAIIAASYVRAHHQFETVGGDWDYYVNENASRTSERRAMAVFWTDIWTGRVINRTFKYLNP